MIARFRIWLERRRQRRLARTLRPCPFSGVIGHPIRPLPTFREIEKTREARK